MAIFGYVRVSTVTQAREGESLEAQRRQVTSYASSKGLELPTENVFIEAGVSGSIEFQERPEGSKLFTQMVAGDMVIFPKLDRAFRNTRNALNVLHDLKGRGISVHFIDLGGDVTGNGVGAIVFTILSAFATFERERIATRIREVKQMKKAQGKFTGGRRAFGYDVIDGVKVPRDDEQAVIREMMKMREGGSTYRQIADWMSSTQERKMTFMGVKRTLELV
ncbi:recombinase family protein [Polynucleobacter paneuropaeus]|nr:recombinase family protein [Polynucleobacter paneuropaeus]